MTKETRPASGAAAPRPPKSEYGRHTWPEINDAVAKGRVAVLAVGSIEGHGPHLPIDCDATIPFEICRRLGERIPDEVIVMPGVAYGIAPHHLDFPGSVTIPEDVYVQFLFAICESLAHHGFDRILIVNGHGGNQAAIETASRMASVRLPGVLCASVAYYLLPKTRAVEDRLRGHETRGSMGHADFAETSLYLAIDPAAVDMSRAAANKLPESETFGFAAEDAPVSLMQHWSALTPTGVMGDPTSANAEAGEAMIEASVEQFIEVVREFRRMVPAPRVDHHRRN